MLMPENKIILNHDKVLTVIKTKIVVQMYANYLYHFV